MLKITASCFRDAICLFRNVLRRMLGVGLIKECVRSAAACVAASSDYILGNMRVAGNKSVVSETRSLSVLRMQDASQC